MDVITIRHSGETVTVYEQRRVVSVSEPVYALDVTTGVMVGGVPYTGAYEADALFRPQVFPTALKTMRQDFLVHAINYTEAPNDFGTTVTIGG